MKLLKTIAAVLGFFILPIVGYAAYGAIIWGYDSAATTPKLSVNVSGVWYEVAFLSGGKFVSITSDFNVLRYGADPTGVADSAAAFTSAVSTGSRNVFVPCGTYLFNTAVQLPSNTDIGGANKGCVTIKIPTTIAYNTSYYAQFTTVQAKNAFSGADAVAGNSNIRIHDMTIDGTLGVTGGVLHTIVFNKGSYIHIERMKFLGGGQPSSNDATAFINSDHYWIEDNTCIGMSNACFDQWAGVHDIFIRNNYVDNNLAGGNGDNGILVNGVGTLPAGGGNRPTDPSYNIVIEGNTIENNPGIGINVFGLCATNPDASFACGKTNRATITGNVVRNARGTVGGGIVVGEGDDFTVTGNIIDGTNAGGITIRRSTPLATTPEPTTGALVSGNVVKDTNRLAGTADAIALHANASTNSSIVDNTVLGTKHRFVTYIPSGNVGTYVKFGPYDLGTSGSLSNSGTNTHFDGDHHTYRNIATVSMESNTTLTDTGISISLDKNTVYYFEFTGVTLQASAGGAKIALGGTATISEADYIIEAHCNGITPYVSGRLTAFGTSLSIPGGSGCTTGSWSIRGTIVPSASGTMTVQMAQDVSDVTATSLTRGSVLRAEAITN
jgi:hypothetical protein